MSSNDQKKIIFTCPDCGKENKTTNTNKKQRCHICGVPVELELKRNGHGKNGVIKVLSVKARR